ncbi:MAG: hypothetical protein ABSB73_11560 [Solirubrobacteraceae bacterium]
MSAGEVVEVLGYGPGEPLASGADAAGLWRLVVGDDGVVILQRGKITAVEGTVTRADGTVEPGAPITNVNTGGAS